MNLGTNAQTAPPSAMAESLIRLMAIIAFGSFSTIAALLLANVVQAGEAWPGSIVAKAILPVCVAAIATAVFYYALKKLVPFIDASARAQANSWTP